MKKRLTQSIADRLPSTSHPAGSTVVDGDVPGLRVVVGSKSSTYRLVGKVAGARPITVTIARTDEVSLGVARDRVRELRLKMRQGVDPRLSASAMPNLRQAGETLLDRKAGGLRPRGDRHYARHEAMAWCARNRVGYIFGLAGNKVLLRQVAAVAAVAEDAAMVRLNARAEKVRRYDPFRYAARSWHVERQVIARIEASPKGADSRFVVTNIAGAPRWLYDQIYCARGQAENLIKAHKLHLASDRTSCSSAAANQFRLLIHTAAYWLLHTLRGLAPKRSFWRDAQFDTIRLANQGRRPRHRNGHPHQGRAALDLSLPEQPGAPPRARPRAATLKIALARGR